MNTISKNAIKKNIFYGYLGMLCTFIMKFISRFYFISFLGTEYLGINGFLINIIGILSLTELGIGQAMNFRLYEPVAKDNTEKIKSIMLLYKNAYRIIALIVLIVGLFILPFIPNLIKDSGNINMTLISLYYLIFLFNTVSSYLVSYKFGLLVAQQKNYIISNFDTFFNLLISIIQIIIIIVSKSFVWYLLIQLILQLLQRIIMSIYINRKNPYLKDNNINKIDKNEKANIWKDIKSLLLHKFGEISVYQTDNLIISSFIGIIAVGIVSNYTLIISAVKQLVSSLFNSIIGNIGNFLVTESKENKRRFMDIYNYCAFFIFGYAAICLYIFSTLFIQIFWGTNDILSNVTVFLLALDFYFVGQRITINNIKTSAGIFFQDRYISMIQAIVNLVVSLIFVYWIGITGVFFGTVISGLIPTILRPIIVYKKVLEEDSKRYFLSQLKYLSLIVLLMLFMEKLVSLFDINNLYMLIMSTICISILIILIIISFSIFTKDKGYNNIMKFIVRK